DQVRLHQYLEAAPGGRRIAVDVEAAVRRVKRLSPLGMVRREIRRPHDAAVFLEKAVELLRDVSFVEPVERRLDCRRTGDTLGPGLLFGVDQLAKCAGVVAIPQEV